VSALPSQGGGSPMLGGSNRTIIKLAQQLVIDPSNGLGDEEVGALVTLDRASRLLEEALPTSWRHEIEQVADKYTSGATETHVMQAVALCSDVPALPLTEANLAALLHPRIDAESRRAQVAEALVKLVGDDRLRPGDEGYHIQSPEQKDWEKTRRGKEPRPADVIRIRKAIIRQALTGLSATKGRSFKVELWVEGEKLADGDVALHVEEADAARRDQLRNASREAAAANQVTWVYSLSDGAYQSIEEWYRSDEMIKTKETPSKTPAEVELLGEERQRLSRIERQLIERLTRDMTAGQVAFRGTLEDAPGGTIAQAAQKLMTDRIGIIYDRLDHFAAQLSAKDVLTVLRTDDLSTAASALTEDGIGLVRLTPQGYQIATETSPLDDLLKITQNEIRYGHLVTGALLANKLAEPPRGAGIEVVQALCAAAVRSGLLEVTYQGAKIGTPSDQRLDRVFGKLTDFRSASFAPPSAGPSVETRVEVATNLDKLTGVKSPIDTIGLAAALRRYFGPDTEACATISAGLMGAGLPVPESVTRLRNVVSSFRQASDADVVTTAAAAWADLVGDHDTIQKMAQTLDDDLPLVSKARTEIDAGADGLPRDAAAALAELADLLAAGDLFTHRGQIKGLTTKVVHSRQTAANKARQALTEKVEGLRAGVRERFTGMDSAKVAEALRPLDDLLPSGPSAKTSLAELQGRLEVAEARCTHATRVLEELQAAGNLSRIQVSQVAPEPITTEAELDVALEHVRQAVLAELVEGKQVRLQ
jgi:hypothetical protein